MGDGKNKNAREDLAKPIINRSTSPYELKKELVHLTPTSHNGDDGSSS
jgi:hypothetical protein